MVTDLMCLLVFTLWSASVVGSAFNSRNEKIQDPFIEAANKFSVSLMKEVSRGPGNLVVSPLSVSTLLAMLQQGARDNSAVQLESVLHMKSEVALSGFHSLISTLKARESRSLFNFGNSMFVNQDFDLLIDFREAMGQYFQATVQSVDFRSPRLAARTINQWVSNSTLGKIGEIVRPNAISGRTEMVLANAMYFKGAWVNPFNPNHTSRQPFYQAQRASPATVDMMTMQAALRADHDTDTLNAKWVELLYEGYGDDYAMIVVLPNDNLDSLMSRLTVSHLATLATSQSVRDVALKMPRFQIETDLSLVPTLQALGLRDVFSQRSNLEGISTNKGPLIVSDVLHKAQIQVNEHGSQASAASSILVNTLSLPPKYPKMDFVANQPFLAMIVDKVSSLPLFMAKIVNP